MQRVEYILRDGGRTSGSLLRAYHQSASSEGANPPGTWSEDLRPDAIVGVRHQPPEALVLAGVVAPLVAARRVRLGAVHPRHLSVQGDTVRGAQVVPGLGLGERVGRPGGGHVQSGPVAGHVGHARDRRHDGTLGRHVAGRRVPTPGSTAAFRTGRPAVVGPDLGLGAPVGAGGLHVVALRATVVLGGSGRGDGRHQQSEQAESEHGSLLG